MHTTFDQSHTQISIKECFVIRDKTRQSVSEKSICLHLILDIHSMQYPLFAILQFAKFIRGIMESINGKPKHETNINLRGPTVMANY